MRTDQNNNPTAFTTDIAKQAGLVLGEDYEIGDPFKINNNTYFTAKLLGDPILITIKVIDRLGFYNQAGHLRWEYIGIPPIIWNNLNQTLKIKVVGFMYSREGGTELAHYFV